MSIESEVLSGAFQELGLAAPILRAIEQQGYTVPTAIQAESIPHVLVGHDLIGCAQTGTGKTAAFVLPILHRLIAEGPTPRGASRRIRVLILAPTRELACQIGESVNTYASQTTLRETVVYGGVSQHRQVQALQRGVDILVATPGRLVDLFQQGFIDFAGVQTLVLDEADRMLDMGFLPQIKRVIAQLPKRRQTLFFSATMPPAVEALAQGILTHPRKVSIESRKTESLRIDQSVRIVAKVDKPRLLMQILRAEPQVRAIVFTKTKHGAERLAKMLQREEIRADAIHGNKSQGARQRALLAFRSPRPPVLVATDVAARGIDVDGVTHVINFDLPQEIETYTHRIGRTARAGAAGIAITFCEPQERRSLREIEKCIRQTLPVVRFSLPAENRETDSAHAESPHADSPRTGARHAEHRDGQPPRHGHPRAQAQYPSRTRRPQAARPSSQSARYPQQGEARPAQPHVKRTGPAYSISSAVAASSIDVEADQVGQRTPLEAANRTGKRRKSRPGKRERALASGR